MGIKVEINYMIERNESVSIETDDFIFEAPEGYRIERLDEQAELIGLNTELLVIASYSIDKLSSSEEVEGFTNKLKKAMLEAIDEPDLVVTGKLTKAVTDDGLPVWSVLTVATDKSHFFDQYAIFNGSIAVVVSIEGDYENRASSAHIEEAVYDIEFKQS